MEKSALLILGNQLFPQHLLKEIPTKNIFMREDPELCTYYRFHKHKIIFFLAAMRTYAKALIKSKYNVHYEELGENPGSYEKSLLSFIKDNKINKVFAFEIEDKFFETRLIKIFEKANVELQVLPSPMFLTSRKEFATYLSSYKKPFMKTFYESQRKRLKVLIDKDDKPTGGKWSFDEENRLPLPANRLPPDVPLIRPSPIVKQVQELVEARFPQHPGRSEQFWLPVSREEALSWLDSFLEERLTNFGPYEDAIPTHSDFVYHSVLTPFLNTGLVTPDEVIESTLLYAKKNKINIASVEGFIRQVIGWREFIRGIYQNFSDTQESGNFFKHKKKLNNLWYTGQTGIAPLDATIRKTNKYAYAHHIERLMVVGSLMLLLEVDPHEAYRWFMEMFIDSSDWVMGPNVFGMALFSDGGIFATKPYFCGSNYYRKMGGYKASEPWCDGVDGLYWSFIEKNKEFFLKNPRMSMMVRTIEKMDPEKKKRIYKAADDLRCRLVQS